MLRCEELLLFLKLLDLFLGLQEDLLHAWGGALGLQETGKQMTVLLLPRLHL